MIVGNWQTRLYRIDVFRRQRDAGDAEALDPAVEQHADIIAGLDAVGFGKGLVDRRAADERGSGAVPRRRCNRASACHRRDQRDDARRDRQRGGRPVDNDVADDAWFDGGDAGDGVDPVNIESGARFRVTKT